MPERLEGIRQRAFKAVAQGRAATVKFVFAKIQIGLAYCDVAACTTDASRKTDYYDRARVSLSEALSLAAHVHLESDVLVRDEFVAAAALLSQALAKLDAEANSLTRKRQKREASFSR